MFFIFFVIADFISIYKFYVGEKRTIGNLASSNVKNSMLIVSHSVKNNLEKINNLNYIKSKIDNIAISDNFIKNIIITDKNGDIIYYSLPTNSIETRFFKNIRDYNDQSIFAYKGCKNVIELYRGMKKYTYKIYIEINKNYLMTLLNDALYDSIKYFMIFLLFVLGLLWLLMEQLIVVPLEKLRQFAYYSLNKPKEFAIKEIESIRYSLDITFNRLKKEQDELYRLSTKDTLSGLYNRLSLFEKINFLISKYSREKKVFVILFIDLDNFKNINDLLGHNVGDQVLKEVAKVLLSSVRENDYVARIGGDEFVIVIEEFRNNMQIVEICERILEKLSKPIKKEEYYFSISASIGIVLFPKNGTNSTDLIKNADIAMYKAKLLGKNQFYFFTEKLNQLLHEKVKVQHKMKEALKNKEFELYYQPKVEIATGRIVGCEALIRWNDPQTGLIPPYKFIPIAEENGFIVSIGEWVLREGMEQIRRWNDTPLKELKVSINVSAHQFKDAKFYDKVEKYSKTIERSKLDLEITESVFLENSKKNIEIISKIKELGISFSLDDFGTGYSSLSYLRDIPIDTLKIDKSFIDNFNIETGKTFIKMIVDVGKTLDLNIVAEGVEDNEQLLFLKTIKCDMYQGYYCSRPLQAREFESLYMKNLKEQCL